MSSACGHGAEACRAMVSMPSGWLPSAVQRMKSNRMVAPRALLLPILAALLIALPLRAAGGVQYFCYGMGRLMDKCCCPHATTVQSVDRAGCGSEIKSRDCCERLERASASLATPLRERASSVVGATPALAGPVASVVCVFEPEARDVVAGPIAARAPPPRGPPIFLLNCALLT